MIINDNLKFAFIHIPKCGGTTVRSYLQKFDDLHGAFRGRVDTHPQLGKVDVGHIPLFVLQDHYPTQLEAIKNYWSFAVLRDPFSRFPSSISQRLRMYGNHRLEDLSKRELQNAVDCDIQFLSRSKDTKVLLPSEYIHFQRQTDYVYADGECLISRLYTLDNIHLLMLDIQKKFGGGIIDSNMKVHCVGRLNESLVMRNEFLRFVYKVVRPASKVLRAPIFKPIKNQIKNAFLIQRDSRYRDFFHSETIRSFISDYYSEDIALYKQIRELGGVVDKAT